MNLEHLASDPVSFVTEVLVNPQTGKPFTLYQQQQDFLRWGFTLTRDRRLPFTEYLFSAPKKSGKSVFAALVMIYVIVGLGEPFAEGYCLANDEEQASSRVFRAVARIVEASPLLRSSAKVFSNIIEFPSTGATITALASDYAGAAGANPNLSVFDELWAYTSERARRLWDEMIPVPTRGVSARLTVTYAGFDGESELLKELYHRGLAGQDIAPDFRSADGLFMYWTHKLCAPWQTEEWCQQMRSSLRANQFARMIENRWVATESTFVDMDCWDACVDPDVSPILENRELSVYVGVDASTKRDSTAIVVATFDGKKVRLVGHRIFQPKPNDPLDFESTVEQTILELGRRFSLRAVLFDPYQMASVSQRLARAGLRMCEFAQTVPNLTAASSNLYELIKGRNLVVYPDADLRLAVSRSVAVETTRGWRIAKEKTSHKIDVVVALALAALAAVERGGPVEGSVASAAAYTILDRSRPDWVSQHLRALGFDPEAGGYEAP